MNRLTKFFYSFDVLDDNEVKFTDYMKNYGTPVMSKYCTNWELYKLKATLRGENTPQYIGCFEIPNIEAFYNIDPPDEMTKTIEEASKVCSNIKEWIGEVIASNIKK